MNPDCTAVFHFDTVAPLCPVVLLKDALCAFHEGTKGHTHTKKKPDTFAINWVCSEHQRSMEVGQTVPTSPSVYGALLKQPTNKNTILWGSTSELRYKTSGFMEQPKMRVLLGNQKQEQSFAVGRIQIASCHSFQLRSQQNEIRLYLIRII